MDNENKNEQGGTDQQAEKTFSVKKFYKFQGISANRAIHSFHMITVL